MGNRDFAGGTTSSNSVVMVLPSVFTYKKLMFLVAHEVVHLAQICKGQLILVFGFEIWRGEESLPLPPNSPNNFCTQPWKNEADELPPILLKFLEKEVARQSE